MLDSPQGTNPIRYHTTATAGAPVRRTRRQGKSSGREERKDRVRVVIQRVSSASVRVDGTTVGEIGRGLLVLVGIERGDGPPQVKAAAEKLAGLRVFEDEAGKMNLDTAAAGGAFLIVSQFTLAGSIERGRRPSFDRAAPPADAEPLIDALVADLRQRGFRVETGRFRAHMDVALVNDGPVTLVADFRAKLR
jgi:D-aminoacyl-tRNA deacylase